MSGRNIGLVVTGGTIGSVHEGGAVVVDPDAEQSARELADEAARDLDVELCVRTPFARHSEELVPADWLSLAALVESLAQDVDAVVVLHGTDTAAYTAAALTYLLCDVGVTVVVTGALAPPTDPRSDAVANVRGALLAATALSAGAYLAFSDPTGDVVVHLGTRVRKSGGSPVFVPVAREPVAVVRRDQVIPYRPAPEPSAPAAWRAHLDQRVNVIGCHPGQPVEPMAAWAVAAGVRGLVLRLYPSMTAPTGPGAASAEAAVRHATEAGVVVVGTAREPGAVAPSRYSSTLAIERAGAVLLHPLCTEAALPKLMWALAQSDEPSVVRRALTSPIRGDLETSASRRGPAPG